jgi:outer membrane protein insertion porin family
MRFKFFVISFIALALSVLGPITAPQLSSAAYAAGISQIIVEGNQRVEQETVESYLQLGVGDQFNDGKIDDSIKVLFQTGLFSDVKIAARGSALVISVVENPLINVVNFEGNEELDDDALAKEVEIRERMIFTKSRVQSDTRRILALYQKTGFYNVRVAPKLIRLPQNRVNLVFEVTEGSETNVKTIDFTGNDYFSDNTLRSVIGTAETSWWNYFQRNDKYDPDRLEYDKDLVRRHYLKNGFADAKVISSDVQLSPGGEYFTISIAVEEGKRYEIADVAVNVGEANLDPNDLRSVIKTGVGDTYDASRVDRTVENLTLEASKQGFVFAKVEPDVQRVEGTNGLNLTYNITEGQRNYIERIDIVGNYRTLDEVIRRELRLFEGDAFNRTLIERARRRLTALDYFDKIEFRDEEGSSPDKIVLVVEVMEKATGKISFSIGYSSTEKVVGSVSLSERNLFGKGQTINLNTTLSFKRQQVDFSFTEPYFMGMPIAAGFDIFATKTDNTSTSSYTSEQIGGALRAGFKLDEFSTINFKYYLAYRDISGIDASKASPAVIATEGDSWKSAISANYVWDNLDNPNDPQSGLRAQIEGELSGLGGSTYYASIEGHAWYFVPVIEDKLILKFEANAGHIQSLNDDNVDLQDRFFKGADSFRGFAKSGVGPKQIGNDGIQDSIGGQTYAIGTIEANFPVGLPESWGIEGAVFTDFGTVFGAPEESVLVSVDGCTRVGGCTVFDDVAFRATIGAGLIWKSPFGPLRFEAAYPLMAESYDDKEWFRFSIGTRF